MYSSNSFLFLNFDGKALSSLSEDTKNSGITGNMVWSCRENGILMRFLLCVVTPLSAGLIEIPLLASKILRRLEEKSEEGRGEKDAERLTLISGCC